MQTENAYAMRLMDRPEFSSKPQPLTFSPKTLVTTAAQAMNERNFGSVMVVDPDDRVLGVVTERDILRKVVARKADATSLTLEDIMTRDPRVARETDEVIDWLRIMSNDRFRRLPVVDADEMDQGRVHAGRFRQLHMARHGLSGQGTGQGKRGAQLSDLADRRGHHAVFDPHGDRRERDASRAQSTRLMKM